MRKSFNGLAAAARNTIQVDPSSGVSAQQNRSIQE
jgi:hypothetical protein